MPAEGPARSRHGRPPEEEPTDPATRSTLVRLAVIPAACISVLAAAVVFYVLKAQAGAADAVTWAVLSSASVLGISALVLAARAATAEARRSAQRHNFVRHAVGKGRADLQWMVDALQRGDVVEQPFVSQRAPAASDGFSSLVHEINLLTFESTAAVVYAAQHRQVSDPGNGEDRVEVFVNLARRLQSLAHRQLRRLEELENEVEDPELLTALFHVDHMATRIRRHAENVAVLGGSISRRQWSTPIKMTEVLRSAISEIEQYSRVKLVPPIDGSLRGQAVADVIHLLAELLENATMFSEPTTVVLLRAQKVTAGLAIEVEDRGLGISPAEQARLNTLFTEPDRIDLSKLLVDGRIGLYVVSELARRHKIVVQLRTSIYGGIQAVVVLPHTLIGDTPSQMPPQAAVEAPLPVAAAANQHPPALQTGPTTEYAHPRIDTTEPMTQQPAMPQGQRPVAAPAPQPQQQPQRPAEPDHRQASHAPGPYDRDRRIGRPQLPERTPQTHLAEPLREQSSAPTTVREEAVHDPGLMATFRRGVNRADETDATGPADDSR
ncbi:ATP-binding protein [Streptomyces sp. NPDC047009]|uniref:sensor histidine kinase n=1 Tax=Streptomyces sp. NPDC047009 TaxID=3154496 RepID=UPI0033BFF499